MFSMPFLSWTVTKNSRKVNGAQNAIHVIVTELVRRNSTMLSESISPGFLYLWPLNCTGDRTTLVVVSCSSFFQLALCLELFFAFCVPHHMFKILRSLKSLNLSYVYWKHWKRRTMEQPTWCLHAAVLIYTVCGQDLGGGGAPFLQVRLLRLVWMAFCCFASDIGNIKRGWCIFIGVYS